MGNACAAACIAKQAGVAVVGVGVGVLRLGHIDGQIANAVAQAIQAAGKAGGVCVVAVAANGLKAIACTGIAVPDRRGTGINIPAQGVVAGQVCLHGLQLGHVLDDGIALAVDAEQAGAGLRKVHPAFDVQLAVCCWSRCGVALGAAIVQRQCPRAAYIDAGVDIDVVVGVERELVGAIAHIGVHMDAACLAAAVHGLQSHIGMGQIGDQGVCTYAAVGLGGSAGADGEVRGVDQPFPGLAVGGQGGHAGAGLDLHPGSAGVHKAAVAAMTATIACGGAGVQQAGHLGAAMLHIGQQHNAAFLLGQGAGLHGAGVGDHAGRECIGGAAGHQHLAAVGHDELFVLNQRLDGGGLHRHLQPAAHAGAQRDAVTRRHHHIAQLGADDALVLHGGRQQGHQAGLPPIAMGGDLALVDDAGRTACTAVTAEHRLAGHEVGIAAVQGAGYQPAHIHAAALAKHHAVGVEHPDLAVGAELAMDLAGVAGHHAVQRHGAGARLVETHRSLAADVKALPVDDGPVAALVDRHLVAALADAGLAGRHLAPGGQGIDGGRLGPGIATHGHQAQQHADRGHGLAGLAPALGGFGGGNVACAVGAAYKAVEVVHAGLRVMQQPGAGSQNMNKNCLQRLSVLRWQLWICEFWRFAGGRVSS